ncbi:MAG TPA: hypothetical protein VIG24_20090 [Acidimicrobiia bacterium]
MPDETDPLESRWEPRPISEMLAELGEVDLSKWSDPVDLKEFSDPLSLDLDAPSKTPRRKRAPGARQAAAVLDQIASFSRGATDPASRFDNGRIIEALTVAATALRSGEDWRQAVEGVYSR